jgi:hypothetical protein
MKYAKKTKVPVSRSRTEIEDIVTNYGAQEFGSMMKPGSAVVAFKVENRNVRFSLPLPDPSNEQEVRQRWRALALRIKAKLAAVEAEIAEFDEEFMPHIVLPNGETIAERILPQLASMKDTPLLLGPVQ